MYESLKCKTLKWKCSDANRRREEGVVDAYERMQKQERKRERASDRAALNGWPLQKLAYIVILIYNFPFWIDQLWRHLTSENTDSRQTLYSASLIWFVSHKNVQKIWRRWWWKAAKQTQMLIFELSELFLKI